MKPPFRHGRRPETPGASDAPQRKNFKPRLDSANERETRQGGARQGEAWQEAPRSDERAPSRFKPKADFGNRDFARSSGDGGDMPPRPKDKARFAPKPKKEKYQAPEDCDVLYGIHTVREALLNAKRRHRRLLVTENAFVRLSEDLALPIAPDVVKAEAINALLPPDAVHQGVYLETERLPLLRLEKLPQDKIIIALDQVTDPHNVGAILRSAAAFDVGAILTTFRNSPDITGVLAKAASGALEHVPLVGVTNLGRALTELKDGGYQIIGLDSEAPEEMHALALRLPVVLVLGAEGKGLRQSTRALCDHNARLELPGAIKSLNVSNAAAISLYAVRQALTRR
ncbi:MAG: putative RNA methyltransferase [Beijerinckiaceae bacterium]|nr:MAG: putative RNA methyltransferase [Beijerinckiaceae bacterium]